jgi:hypothetical protein
LDLLRGLKDSRMILYRVAIAGQMKPEQKKAWEDQVTATCQELLRSANRILDKARKECSRDSAHDTGKQL